METQYTLNDVMNLAHYSAGKYAKNPTEHQQYVTFFKYLYREQIVAGYPINPYQDDHFAITIAVAISRRIFQQAQTAQRSLFEPTYPFFILNPQFGWSIPSTSPPTISAKPIYFNLPKSETNLPTTTLNNQQAAPLAESSGSDNNTKKKRKKKRTQSADKSSKARIAKSIAMDMERWAREFNRKKKESLEAKKKSVEFDGIPIPETEEHKQSKINSAQSLVADYFSTSDSSPDDQLKKCINVIRCRYCKTNIQRAMCHCREMEGDKRKNGNIRKCGPPVKPWANQIPQYLQTTESSTLKTTSGGHKHHKHGISKVTEVGVLSKEQIRRTTYARLKALCKKSNNK